MSTKYVIVQPRIETDDEGKRTAIKEALFAYPDSKTNVMKRINIWTQILEIPNLYMREATSADYRKRRKKTNVKKS